MQAIVDRLKKTKQRSKFILTTNFDVFLYQFSVKTPTGEKTVFIELVDDGCKAQYARQFDEFIE